MTDHLTTDDLRKLLTGLASRQEGEGPDEFVSRQKAAREAVANAAPTILQRLIDAEDLLRDYLKAFDAVSGTIHLEPRVRAYFTPTQTKGSSNG